MPTKPPKQAQDSTQLAAEPKASTGSVEPNLNKLVKDLGLSPPEQWLVAREAMRISKEKKWVSAKAKIEKVLVPFTYSSDARSIGLSSRLKLGTGRQLENLHFEIHERAVEIEVPSQILKPNDGIKLLRPGHEPEEDDDELEDITEKLANLDPDPAKTKAFVEELIAG